MATTKSDTKSHGRRIHRSWGGHIPPLFYTVGVRGYINSVQLFNNTTCLKSCNVVFPALRHSTAVITLAVAYTYIETRQLCRDCGYVKLPCQQDMFTYFLTTIRFYSFTLIINVLTLITFDIRHLTMKRAKFSKPRDTGESH